MYRMWSKVLDCVVLKGGLKEMQKFNRYTRRDGGLYVCRVCGKRTRETGEGESSCLLCKNCYNRGALENDHNDYGHSKKVDNCPECEKILK